MVEHKTEREKLLEELRRLEAEAVEVETEAEREIELSASSGNVRERRQAEKEALDEALAVVKERLQAALAERDEAKAAMEEAMQRAEEKAKHVAALEEELAGLRSSSSGETQRLELEKMEMEKKIAERRKDASTDLQRLQDEASKLQGEYETASGELAAARGALTDIEAAIAAAKLEGTRTQAQMDALAQDWQNTEAEDEARATALVEERAREVAAQDEARSLLLAEMERVQAEAAAMEVAKHKAAEDVARLTAAAAEFASAADQLAELEGVHSELDARVEDLMRTLRAETTLRKQLHSMVEDLKGKVRVYCRVRPLLHNDKEMGQKDVTQIVDEYSLIVEASHQAGSTDREYVFDHVFGPTSTQEHVFEECVQLINNAFNGYNVCLFAYGQTSSGKTYTIHGEEGNEGLTPRAVDRIFELIEESRDEYECAVSCYMLELYNDILFDLFADPDNPPAGKLKIKLSPSAMVYVQNAVEKEVHSAEEQLAILHSAVDNRHVAATQMNADSSRSHLVFSMLIRAKHRKTGHETTGKLTLVDLAGSERVGKSGAEGMQLTEARAINKSLAALGNVISALSGGKQAFVPYRNNPLTLLLMDSLGGAAKTLMFVNISPSSSNIDETRNTLEYGQRAKNIVNAPAKETKQKLLRRMQVIIDFLVRKAQPLLDEEQMAKVTALLAEAGYTSSTSLDYGSSSSVDDERGRSLAVAVPGRGERRMSNLSVGGRRGSVRPT